MTDLLFNEHTMSYFMLERAQTLETIVQKADSSLFESDADLRRFAEDTVEKLKLQAPELDEDRMTADNEESMLQGSYVMNIKLHVPFSGDSKLMYVQPSTFTFNPPLGQVRGDELVLDVVVRDSEFDANSVRGYVDGAVGRVSTYLRYLDEDCRSWNDRLPRMVNDSINQRKRRLRHQNEVFAEAGIIRRHDAGHRATG